MSSSIRRPTSEAGSNAAPRWFCLIFAIATVFQVVRLTSDSPGIWLATDYAMRIAALSLVALSPVRGAVFRREPLRVPSEQLVASLLIAGGAIFLIVLVERKLWDILPDLSLGRYPRTTGLLYFLDLTFGLALVAIHEELIFRRLARLAFSRLGDGRTMVAATSLVFAVYHWWTGPLNVLMVALTGVVLMLLYRTVGALWPAMAVHYCVDLYAFA